MLLAGSLSYLFKEPRLTLGNGTGYSGLDPPTSISNQENAANIVTSQSDLDNSLVEVSSCLMILGFCQVDN